MSKNILKTKWEDEEEARKQVLIRFIRLDVAEGNFSIKKGNSHTDYRKINNSRKYRNYEIQECTCKMKTTNKGEGEVSRYLDQIKQGPPDKTFVGFLRFIRGNVSLRDFETLMGGEQRRHVFISKTFTAETDLEHNVGAYTYRDKNGNPTDEPQVHVDYGKKIMTLKGYNKVNVIKPDSGDLTVFKGCDKPVSEFDDPHYNTKYGPPSIKHPIEGFNPSEESSLAVAPLGTCMAGISPNYNEVNFKGSGEIEGYLIKFDGAAKHYKPTLKKIIDELCMGKNKCNEEEIYVLEPHKAETLKSKLSSILKRKSDKEGLEFLKKYENPYGYEIVKDNLVKILRNLLINDLSGIKKNLEKQQEIVNGYKNTYGVDTVKNIHKSLLAQFKNITPGHYLHTLDFSSEPIMIKKDIILKKFKSDDNSSKRKRNVEDPSRNGKGKRKRNE